MTDERACPFCGGSDKSFLGVRSGASFDRCTSCRSIYMRITEEQFRGRHVDGWADDDFIKHVQETLGQTPDHDAWSKIAGQFPAGSPILEIGSGTGHLLAAAHEVGHPVAAVETSAINRRFISETWNIEAAYESLDSLPSGATFAGVVINNTIEHMYDPASFLRALRPFVTDEAVIYISTCNADALVVRLVGTMWSMFKTVDHVSFPSARGFGRLAERCGFTAERIWTSEYPLETVASTAVAVRDWWRERRSVAGTPPPVQHAAAEVDRQQCDGGVSFGRRLLYLSRTLHAVDPSSPIISWCGMGGSIKAVYRPA